MTEPKSLSSDSKSARDVAYNPEHHACMKHVLRRHFYVRDMVEEFKINVPFVRSAVTCQHLRLPHEAVQ